MKTTKCNLRFWCLLLTVAGALTLSASAMPPIQHSVVGGIERIDVQQRELVVTNDAQRIAVHWNDRTGFNEHPTPGARVRVYYRKELGRSIARDVKLARSNVCMCCCKEGKYADSSEKIGCRINGWRNVAGVVSVQP